MQLSFYISDIYPAMMELQSIYLLKTDTDIHSESEVIEVKLHNLYDFDLALWRKRK